MQALLHDVVEKMGSYLTRLQLHLAVTIGQNRPSDFDPLIGILPHNSPIKLLKNGAAGWGLFPNPEPLRTPMAASHGGGSGSRRHAHGSEPKLVKIDLALQIVRAARVHF